MSESCYHCGDEVIGRGYSLDDKSFCCNGCKSVFQLLNENGLNSFYEMEENAGSKPKTADIHRYDFLDLPAIRDRYIDFEDENSIHVVLFLPAIHCSSCIYLLENINKIESNILSCQTNFTERTARIIFLKSSFTFPDLAVLLDKIGYPPNFEEKKKVNESIDKTFLYKIGVAGFAFGSIMLWSFPEYLGMENLDKGLRSFTSYLSFFLSIPVLLYSARDYYVSAYKAIRYKQVNIDVPITLGIIALYAQSCHHIFSGSGPGYMDSFAGFIFFLLIGKWFQRKTYRSLSFDRDYTSYFPVAVLRVVDEEEQIVEIEKIEEGDHLMIRNDEIVPCDVILLSNSAQIDYSFVTGESVPVSIAKGQLVYAGGRLIGAKTRFQAKSKSERSRLANLWNKSKESEHGKSNSKGSWDRLSSYFLIGVIIVASASAILWAFIDANQIVVTVVSVLIVACPCALALSRPFTFGNTMRKLGRNGLYLQNTEVIEQINLVTDIVFDKTGTLTKGSQEKVVFEGDELSEMEWVSVLILANSSTHVLSRTIVRWIKNKELKVDSNLELTNYQEIIGQGILGKVNGMSVKIGNAKSMGLANGDGTYVTIGGEVKGKFLFESELRDGLEAMFSKLSLKYSVHVLSGDSGKDAALMKSAFPKIEHCYFKQSPEDKFNYTKRLQSEGKHVMMIGDGLNDSGALAKADVGIAISEDVFQFSPNSNGILEANHLYRLTSLLETSNFSKTVLRICLGFSILYNLVGLGFAITGNLTPLIAAILMPLSSISIVLISTVFIHFRK
ncbi:MAG: heavy metal translocating P-type ATPase metal-binding domain-containing protein [Crocinitomicaceae bacterium]|nr:heavy metal translocating P-type ATPase metal-binding domain-containing protein [Flavobacteriales bacterium]NQZ35345.1 heavy metal translocating P-type ATPase metal-binding domain-containing protein [Crocinitomicaceae bacterium]